MGQRLLYRGRVATDLLKSGSYGAVAELLWTATPGTSRLRLPEQPTQGLLRKLQDSMPMASLPLDRLKAAAVPLGASDPFRYDLSRSAVISIARTPAPAFVESLPAWVRAEEGQDQDTGDSLATRLRSKLSGPSRPPPSCHSVRGDRVSGFGQPRYPGPDPRAAATMTLLAGSGGDQDRQHIVREVVDLVHRRRDLAPNAEFALGAMCFVHRMPRGAGEAVFVIARSAGWIVHAIEKYETAPGTNPPFTRG